MSSEIIVDDAMLTRLREGDEKAFRLIYDMHYRKIYQFAFSFLKNKEQSEEVLQETFINIWINRAKLDVQMPIEPLLFTVSKRLVLDGFRKATSTNKLRSNLMLMINEADNKTEENIILTDLMRFTESAISNLPKQQQIIFRLSRFEGFSYEEIAEKLNISKNTVRNHLVAALKTLRSQLEGQDLQYVLFMLFFKKFL